MSVAKHAELILDLRVLRSLTSPTMILDVITSSPLNVFFTLVIGIGLAYLYCKKPSTSSSSSSRSHPSNAGSNRSAGTSNIAIDPEIQRVLAQIERQERDSIRQEQDEAYRQSLKADREKQIKREEEVRTRETQEREERERQAKRQEIHKELTKLKSDIGNRVLPEPDKTEDGIIKLVFKLPDGARHKRTFRKSDAIMHLYWFVFSLENAPLQFKLTTHFPKRELPGHSPHIEDFRRKETQKAVTREEGQQTLEEAEITETQIIFVYDLDA